MLICNFLRFGGRSHPALLTSRDEGIPVSYIVELNLR